MQVPKLEDRFFLLIVAIVTLAFFWVIMPFFGAILWGIVVAILFTPLNRRLRIAMPNKPGLAAMITLLAVIAIVIIPALFLSSMLVQEAASVYNGVRTGQIDFGHYFAQIIDALPRWAQRTLGRYGFTDIDSLQSRISKTMGGSVQVIATRAFAITQSAFSFFLAMGVMLYLTFFLLRDGKSTARMLDRAVPLRPEQWRALVDRFEAVIRATIKGSLVVAIVQGAIGGITLWALGVGGAVLWGVAMGFFSLIPAIGAGLVWVPIAIYLLATGAMAKGIILIVCGALVIGMVDNVLRPILVGRDTRMPDYMVLISTLGGIEIFGFNGFVIGPVIAALFLSAWEIFARDRAGQPLEDPVDPLPEKAAKRDGARSD